MKRMRKYMGDIMLGCRLVKYRDEVEFLGPCPCGKCGHWKVRFRGHEVHLLEKTYDKLRFLQAMT